MKTKIPSVCLLLLITAVSSTFAREMDLEKPSPKLRRFATDAIFEVEAGDREKYSKRLPESVLVEFHGEPGPRPVAEKHLDALFQTTGVKRIDQPVSGQTAAKIGIYFGPQAELVKTAKVLDNEINMDGGVTFWKWWDGSRTINRAVILVATDKISGANLEDKLIEQLLGVFGLPARSKEFDESCLSANEDQVVTSLQPVDKALLEFYYRAVPPGTKPKEFETIFREQWEKKR